MESIEVVGALSALAHQHRLAVYRLLVEQGPAGLPAGAIAERVGLVPSSLTFHLQHLARAGLVTQQRVSRQIFYSADFTAMDALLGYLTDKCCTAGARACAPSRKAGAGPEPSSRNRRSA